MATLVISLGGSLIIPKEIDTVFLKNFSAIIKKISFKNFKKIADKIKYSAGQHFVLDQVAAGILSKVKIKTFIINGRNIKNFMNVLKGKVFIGTMIYD